MSSIGHLDGVMHFDDLQSERHYDPEQAYEQSKLANLLFTYELDRRLRDAGRGVAALACHPGVVLTDLFVHRPGWQRILLSPAMRIINFWAVQDVRAPSHDEADQARLWRVSEQLTGVSYAALC